MELDKKRERRIRAAETAMQTIPLQPGAEQRIPSFRDVFEQTYVGVLKEKGKPDPKAIALQMSELTKISTKLADHIDRMPIDMVVEFSTGGDSSTASWQS